MGIFRLPNGAVYETGDLVNTNGVVEKEGKPDMAKTVNHQSPPPCTLGQVAKTNLEKAAELDGQAARWDALVQKNTYGMDRELRSYYLDKIKAARREASRLRGEPVADLETGQVASKTISLTLPR
jgi:hypothetical protein